MTTRRSALGAMIECFFGLPRHEGACNPAGLKYAAFTNNEVSR